MGIMPKPVVHECLTGHEHNIALHSGQDEITPAGTILTCDCHEVVFVSSFDLPVETAVAPIASFYPPLSPNISSIIVDAAPDNRALRGPPASL